MGSSVTFLSILQLLCKLRPWAQFAFLRDFLQSFLHIEDNQIFFTASP